MSIDVVIAQAPAIDVVPELWVIDVVSPVEQRVIDASFTNSGIDVVAGASELRVSIDESVLDVTVVATVIDVEIGGAGPIGAASTVPGPPGPPGPPGASGAVAFTANFDVMDAGSF